MIDYFLIWTGEINRDQEALAAAANDAAVAVIDIANQRFKMQSRNVTVTEATDSHAAAENEILKIELQKASVNLNFSYPEFTNPNPNPQCEGSQRSSSGERAGETGNTNPNPNPNPDS